MKWQKVKLEEIAQIKGGKRLPSGHDFSTTPTPHLYIRARDIGDGKITLSDPVYIAEQTANVLRNYTVNENDIVITIVGANIGDIGFITKELEGANLTENAAKVSVSSEVCNPKFLQVQLATGATKHRFQSIIGGAAQGKLGLFKIKDFEVSLPPLAIQNKIADILSTYDDLIENNRRRIDLLEQSARMLYKEWFVSLRFPGHEHVKVKDDVPQGWDRQSVKDVIKTVDRKKKIQKSDYLQDGTIPCVDQSREFIGGYTDDMEALIDEEKPVIVFGDHTRIFKFVNFPFASGADGTQLITARDESVSQEFLFFALEATDLSNYFYARHFKFLKAQSVLMPPHALVDSFTVVVHPMMSQIKILREANTKLQKARDLLLPRLMNGEIPV